MAKPLPGDELVRRGSELVRDQHYEAAIVELNRAIHLGTASPGAAHFFRGIAFGKIGKHSDAIVDFTAAVDADPLGRQVEGGVAEYRIHRARCSYRLMRFREAISDLSEVIRFPGATATLLVWRGLAAQLTADYCGALFDFLEAIRLEADNPIALHQAAYLLSGCPEPKFRDGAEAAGFAMRACEISSWKDWIFVTGLAGAYAELGEFDQAIRYAELVLKLAPEEEQPERLVRLEQYHNNEPFRFDPVEDAARLRFDA